MKGDIKFAKLRILLPTGFIHTHQVNEIGTISNKKMSILCVNVIL